MTVPSKIDSLVTAKRVEKIMRRESKRFQIIYDPNNWFTRFPRAFTFIIIILMGNQSTEITFS